MKLQIGLDALDNKLGGVMTKVTRVNIGIIKLLAEAEAFTGGKGHKNTGDAFDPGQPRDEHGQWSSGGGAEIEHIRAEPGDRRRITEDDPSVYGSELLGWEGKTWGEFRASQKAEAGHKAMMSSPRAMEIRTARGRAMEIGRKIEQTGEHPPGQNWPEGERLLGTDNIHGGGESFTVTPDHVWFMRGNGMDGDDFSRNNVPGAMASRVPRTEEMVNELRDLHATYNGGKIDPPEQ